MTTDRDHADASDPLGAWYAPEPDDPSFCRHGTPNLLTADRPVSSLSHGTTAQHALLEVEKWLGEVPEVSATTRPLRLLDELSR